MTNSKLQCMNSLMQTIHNLKNRFPCGIKSIDIANDEKCKRLILLLKEQYGKEY